MTSINFILQCVYYYYLYHYHYFQVVSGSVLCSLNDSWFRISIVRAEPKKRFVSFQTVTERIYIHTCIQNIPKMLPAVWARCLRDHGTLQRREKNKEGNCSDRFPVREKLQEYQTSKNAQKLNVKRRQARQVEQASQVSVDVEIP